jgi:cytochrome c553
VVLALMLSAQALLAQVGQSAGRALATELGCIGCHAPGVHDGLSSAPRIAGQKMNYLAKQLKDFRDSKPIAPGPHKIRERHHRAMDNQARSLTDKEIQDLVEYFAKLPCEPQLARPPKPPEPLPAAVVRCGFCHGEEGVNPYLEYPNLAGQKKEYLVNELKAFRASALNHGDAEKSPRFHRMMAPSVLDLSDAEIDAISGFFSTRSCS